MNDKHSPRRVALVTGAAMGIGQAVATRLAPDGRDVAIADVADAADTQRLAKGAGAQVHSARVDITDAAAVQGFVAAITKRLGAPAVVVANAGIYPRGLFTETSWEVWRKIMDVNVDATYHPLQATPPAMIEAGWGPSGRARVDRVLLGTAQLSRRQQGRRYQVGMGARLRGRRFGDHGQSGGADGGSNPMSDGGPPGGDGAHRDGPRDPRLQGDAR